MFSDARMREVLVGEPYFWRAMLLEVRSKHRKHWRPVAIGIGGSHIFIDPRALITHQNGP